MDKNMSLTKSWLPPSIVLLLLIIAMFPHLMLLSMFNLNSTFTASFFDMEVEDLQFIFSMGYAMIVCALFVHGRLFGAMNIRLYLLVTTLLNILVLAAMTLTTNIEVIVALRIIQGPLSLFEGCIMIPVLINVMKNKNAKFIAYAILYGMMLTGDKLTTSIIKFVIENYTHNHIIYIIIGFHLFALLIYLVLLNPSRIFPKKPLYQLNLAGVFLLAISLISGAFFLIYGKKLNWFDSPKITIALICCLIFAALFLFYQLTSKRELYHFQIFKSKRIFIGIALFICFYILRSSMSNIYQIMSTVWKWPWQYVLKIQYFNVLGSLVGVGASYYLYSRQVSYKSIFISGFLFLSASMLWFSYLFYPDAQLTQICGALFTEGLGQGILITPLVFYMIGSVSPSISSSASQAGTATRFWTSTFGFALMQNLLWYLTHKYELMLTEHIDAVEATFTHEWNTLYDRYHLSYLSNQASQLSALTLQSKIAKQALLLANMEIFRILFIFGIVILLALCLYTPIKKFLKY